MASRKTVLKVAATKWNAFRKELRQKCKLAGVPVERTRSGAVRAGLLPPKPPSEQSPFADRPQSKPHRFEKEN